MVTKLFLERKSSSITQDQADIDLQIKKIDNFITLFKEKSLFEMTGSETRSIYQLLSSMDYFKKLGQTVTTQEYWIIANSMKLKDYKKSTVIYSYGDRSKVFYLILKGTVNVKIPKLKFRENGTIKKVKETSFYEIDRLGFGAGFGDYALFYKTEREATTECLEDTTVLYFNQEEYNNVFHQLEKDKVAQSINFFKRNKFFQDFTYTEQEKFHFFMQTRLYFSGQSIYKETMNTDGIYFIKTGHFEVYKEVHQENLQEQSEKSSIPLFTLTANECFGDIETITKLKKRQCNVLCINGGEILFINKIAFFNVITSFSLKRKVESTNKKIEILNNNYRIKSLNVNKTGFIYDNDINDFKNKYLIKQMTKNNFEVNYHGFAKNARANLNNFDRQLDNFLINSLSFQEYLSNKTPTRVKVPSKTDFSKMFQLGGSERRDSFPSSDSFDSSDTNPLAQTTKPVKTRISKFFVGDDSQRAKSKSKTSVTLPYINKDVKL